MRVLLQQIDSDASQVKSILDAANAWSNRLQSETATVVHAARTSPGGHFLPGHLPSRPVRQADGIFL
jgi:hypothetical protein